MDEHPVSDAYSMMLDLNLRLGVKEMVGKEFTRAEQMLSDVAWIDTQVSNNGFDGWLRNTSCTRMVRTLEALDYLACASVDVLVKEALDIAAVDPYTMSNEEKDSRVAAMSELRRNAMSQLMGAFYDAADDYMERYIAFAELNGV